MLLSYFILLPLGPLRDARKHDRQYQPVDVEEDDYVPSQSDPPESAGLLAQPEGRSVSPAYVSKQSRSRQAWIDLRSKLVRAKALVIP